MTPSDHFTYVQNYLKKVWYRFRWWREKTSSKYHPQLWVWRVYYSNGKHTYRLGYMEAYSIWAWNKKGTKLVYDPYPEDWHKIIGKGK